MVDPLAWEGKGNLIMIFQNVHAMTDCLDVCKFSTFSESLDGFAAQFAAITGKPCTADELFKAGERVYNLERHYNNLNGFREGSDTLPKRFLTEPSTFRAPRAMSASWTRCWRSTTGCAAGWTASCRKPS